MKGVQKMFTKDEVRRLLILTYLGEWVMTSQHKDESRSEYTDILDKMLSFAHRMGLDEYVSWQDTPSRIEPSMLLEDEGRKFMEEYEDRFFFDELAERLSQVDIEALVRHQKTKPEAI